MVIACRASGRVARGRVVSVFGNVALAADLAAALTGLVDDRGRPLPCPGCRKALFTQGAKTYLVDERCQ